MHIYENYWFSYILFNCYSTVLFLLNRCKNNYNDYIFQCFTVSIYYHIIKGKKVDSLSLPLKLSKCKWQVLLHKESSLDYNFIAMKRISRIKLLGDPSTFLANALGRSIAAGIYVADPLKSDLTNIHLIRPYTSTCRAHTKTVYKPASPMLLKFTFPRAATLELPLYDPPSMCQRINRVLRTYNEIERPRNEGKIVRRVDPSSLGKNVVIASTFLLVFLRAQSPPAFAATREK